MPPKRTKNNGAEGPAPSMCFRTRDSSKARIEAARTVRIRVSVLEKVGAVIREATENSGAKGPAPSMCLQTRDSSAARIEAARTVQIRVSV